MESSDNAAIIIELLRKLATVTELLAFAKGLPLIFLAWVPTACGVPNWWIRFLVIGLAQMIFAVMFSMLPIVIYQSETTLNVAGGFTTALLLLLIQLAGTCYGHFAPYIIARTEDLEKKNEILGFSVAAVFFAPLWFVAFAICGKELKEKRLAATGQTNANPVNKAPVEDLPPVPAVTPVFMPDVTLPQPEETKPEPEVKSEYETKTEPESTT